MFSNPTTNLLHSSLPNPKTNILINNNGQACLTDFGLLTIASDEPTITSSIGATTAQWTSPELLVPNQFGLKESRPTKASDCYALGMVIYEVLSGQTPFAHYSNLAIVQKILDGERPGRPQGEQGAWIADNIWWILEHCWKPQPSDRISAEAVLLGLEGNISPQFSLPGLESNLSLPSCDVDRTVITFDLLEKTIGAGIDERLDAIASGPSTFSPFTEGLRLTLNRPRGITVPTNACGGGGLAVPPQSLPPHTTIMHPGTPSVGEEDRSSGCCSCVIM